MPEPAHFDWIPFYTELAHTLLKYKADRTDLVAKIPSIYEKAGIKMPTLDKDGHLIDIDPFTFFGLFNKHFTSENRIALLTAISQLFHIAAPVPTSFDSIPVLDPRGAVFYEFAPKRAENDIPDLWKLFEAALNYAQNSTLDNRTIFSKWFDTCISKKYIGNSKLTMGLYWIAPDTFLNLDSRNEWFIYESGKVPQEIVQSLPEISKKVTAEDYFEIIDKITAYLQSPSTNLHDFKDLSYAAWTYSQQINDQKKAKRDSAGAAVADNDIATVHYWLYSPGSGAEYWDEFYQSGIMAIGWDEIGNLSDFTSKTGMKKAM